jgi:hypothetical protein
MIKLIVELNSGAKVELVTRSYVTLQSVYVTSITPPEKTCSNKVYASADEDRRVSLHDDPYQFIAQW